MKNRLWTYKPVLLCKKANQCWSSCLTQYNTFSHFPLLPWVHWKRFWFVSKWQCKYTRYVSSVSLTHFFSFCLHWRICTVKRTRHQGTCWSLTVTCFLAHQKQCKQHIKSLFTNVSKLTLTCHISKCSLTWFHSFSRYILFQLHQYLSDSYVLFEHFVHEWTSF